MITNTIIKEVKLSPICSYCGKFTPFSFIGTVGEEEIFCSLEHLQKYYGKYIEMDYRKALDY